ncbi:ABC transporter permease [Pseudoxanthomonas koreensis]|uniref:ABC transporter permease n=1 Tax=Pseudoxanthomonas koreensis TaxID=266061 RepID=UPI001391E278|nr:ABC transporter permease [Pseudoxanthomonas koreensis]KAF1691588.1 sugar ABC transporter permease [Pseudoxanthomonas koreensis]
MNSGLWRNKVLLGKLVQRDIRARYEGSVFGIVWAIATPLSLLGAYWFVLGKVLGARWEGVSVGQLPVVLFIGLVVYLFFSEVMGRAPGLVLANGTYVKKVVFPLEVLSAVTVATALFHLAIALAVLFFGQLIMTGGVPGTWIYMPLVLGAMIPCMLGISWFVSSIAVYLRDVQQVVPLVLTLMMFLSPVFYPLTMVPERYRPFLYLNPLTVPIEQARAIVVSGIGPDWGMVLAYSVVSIACMLAGRWWFMRTKQGFADVL